MRAKSPAILNQRYSAVEVPEIKGRSLTHRCGRLARWRRWPFEIVVLFDDL